MKEMMFDFAGMKFIPIITIENCYNCDCGDGCDGYGGCDCVSCDNCDCDAR
jgi:hypothetical protein